MRSRPASFASSAYMTEEYKFQYGRKERPQMQILPVALVTLTMPDQIRLSILADMKQLSEILSERSGSEMASCMLSRVSFTGISTRSRV